uniref:SLC41A/MgtE integral membrane domain-containing protein n=1 Tax=Noctiluca scintillans TaxID=2966 RepID=A0A7S1FEY5_NOCSC|mmetsp:Transcript_55397/g.147883  ORF Transcript_55397/g.147883 Transcript_55397/m.147883 type:complete len:321 (+) Transcript_55397:49-1011(+)
MASFKSVQFVLAAALWCNVVPCVLCVVSSRQHHAALVSSDEQTGSEVVPVVSDTYFKIHQALNTNVSASSFVRAHAVADKYSRAVAFSLGVLTSIVISIVLFILCVGRWWMEEDALAKGDILAIEQSQETLNSSELPVPAPDMPDVSMSCTHEVESMHLFLPRVSCLVVLLLFQSISSMILDSSSHLFVEHTAIMAFLTMIVGLGGNVGGQSVVLAVRNFATGKRAELCHQSCVTVGIVCVILPVICLRLLMDTVSFSSLMTICISCTVIIVLASVFGFGLPFAMHRARIDPAHATPMVQVVMDIVGVSVVCAVGRVICG